VSFVTIIINQCLKEFIDKFVKKVGFVTKTEEIKWTMASMVILTSINTGIISLFDTANFSEMSGFLSYLFPDNNSGQTDFSQAWYQVTGISFILNLIVAAFMPLIMLFIQTVSSKM